MDKYKLIALYCYIRDHHDMHLRWYCQRFSNNISGPKFTDVECLTIYLFSIMEEEKFKILSIHNYAEKYLNNWFPDLPSYQAFNRRFNRLAGVFPPLICLLLEGVDKHGIQLNISLIDSMTSKYLCIFHYLKLTEQKIKVI